MFLMLCVTLGAWYRRGLSGGDYLHSFQCRTTRDCPPIPAEYVTTCYNIHKPRINVHFETWKMKNDLRAWLYLYLVVCDVVVLFARQRTCDSQVMGSSTGWSPLCNGLGQATYTCAPLSPTSIIWYWPRGSGILQV